MEHLAVPGKQPRNRRPGEEKHDRQGEKKNLEGGNICGNVDKTDKEENEESDDEAQAKPHLSFMSGWCSCQYHAVMWSAYSTASRNGPLAEPSPAYAPPRVPALSSSGQTCGFGPAGAKGMACV